jgi:serine/threonine-protein kinase
MRFIKGDSLKAAIEHFHADEALKKDPGRRSLELRKLLRRFTDVCNAIDYAHSRGVLHRDIKPGNVIVGKHGETLVVDWGLAKSVGRADPRSGAGERTLVPSSASGSAETLPGSALGTPAYMSPEQAGGDLDRLGAWSDVYSLGSTLFCLLTGKPPYQGDDAGEIVRRVQRGEFDPPRRLDPSIDKALETICTKAMALKPEGRYSSCRALAEDIERWMADEPVSAWAEPWTRRMLRWLTRHRTGVTGAAAALLAGVVGLSAVLAVQARANAALADKNTALLAANAKIAARYKLAVDAIETFHTGVSKDFLLKEEKFKDLRDRLLNSAAGFYEKLGALLEDDTDLPSRRALLKANYEVACLAYQVGRKEDALALHLRVLAGRQALAKLAGADRETAVDVSRSLLAVGAALEATGKTDEALASYERARFVVATSDGSPRNDAAARSAFAAAGCRAGELLRTIGRTSEAQNALEQARDLEAALATADPKDSDRQTALANSHVNLGILLFTTGRPAEAEAEWRGALAIQQKLAGDNPADIDCRSRLANSHDNLGELLRQTGKRAEAEAEYRRAIAIQQKLADDNPAVGEFRRDLANSHNNFNILLSDMGKPAEAEAECRKALAIRLNLVHDNPAVTDFRKSLAGSHHNLGVLLSDMGKPAEAEAEYCKALAIEQKLADDNPAVTEFRSMLAGSHNSLGGLMWATGKPAEAVAEFRKGLAIQQKLADDNPTVTDFRSTLASSHNNLGAVLVNTGKRPEAEAEYRKGRAIQQKLVEDNPAVTWYRSRLANSHMNLGSLLLRVGKLAEAESETRKGLAILRNLTDEHPESPDYAHLKGGMLHNLAEVDLGAKRFQEACEGFREAIVSQKKALAAYQKSPEYRQFLAMHLTYLSIAARGLGREDEAIEAERELAELTASDPRFAALDARLAATLKGETPKDNAERLALAQRAYETRRYAAATRLWGGALENDPKLADDREAQHRYNAACAAALAGCGKGTDDPRPDDATKVKLRRQALDWLKADLAAWSKILESGAPRATPVVASILKHWKEDTDLAGIRDDAALAKLPQEERVACIQLWGDVDRLLSKARGAK